MVKKFTTNCSFGGQVSPVTLYVGNPAEGSHPLAFQSRWLGKERGGEIPPNIMDSFSKLSEIAQKNRIPFEEVCAYVIEEVNARASLVADAKKASEFSKTDDKK